MTSNAMMPIASSANARFEPERERSLRRDRCDISVNLAISVQAQNSAAREPGIFAFNAPFHDRIAGKQDDWDSEHEPLFK
jgi:hypothetical protein